MSDRDSTEHVNDDVRVFGERVDETSRRLQIKAAVSAEEKAWFESVARRCGLPLSILIRRELSRLATRLDSEDQER